jgi:hypothetical protein
VNCVPHIASSSLCVVRNLCHSKLSICRMFAGAASMRATGSDSVFGAFPDSGSRFGRSGGKGEEGNLAGMLSRMVRRSSIAHALGCTWWWPMGMVCWVPVVVTWYRWTAPFRHPGMALPVCLQGGLMPGQHHTPMRIGRDLHPLWAVNEAAANGSSAVAAESAADVGADQFGSREVAGVAASKYFSVLRSSSGEVWTCGGEQHLLVVAWSCTLEHGASAVCRQHVGGLQRSRLRCTPYRRLQWRAGSAVIVGDLPAPGVWTSPRGGGRLGMSAVATRMCVL